MPIEPVMLVGAGGHARVVLDAWRVQGNSGSIAVFDDALEKAGFDWFGLTVRSPVVWNPGEFSSFHVAIGDNAARRRLWERGCQAGLRPRTIAHPASVVSNTARVGDGVFVAALAVLAPGALVGAGTIVNHGAIVDHDCNIGNFCHIAPGAVLGGNVRVGNSVLLGAGSTVLPGRNVGEGARVGAGAVVTCDVPPGETVIGIPARGLHKCGK
jgi:sugar O-acyltransferase (sialic acid O-acetyltransferase NeuD family)